MTRAIVTCWALTTAACLVSMVWAIEKLETARETKEMAVQGMRSCEMGLVRADARLKMYEEWMRWAKDSRAPRGVGGQ